MKKPRPEVQWFADQLEAELAKGDDSGPYTDWWMGIDGSVCLRRQRATLVELEAAVISASAINEDACARRLRVIELAAKAASFLVMVATEWRPFPREPLDKLYTQHPLESAADAVIRIWDDAKQLNDNFREFEAAIESLRAARKGGG